MNMILHPKYNVFIRPSEATAGGTTTQESPDNLYTYYAITIKPVLKLISSVVSKSDFRDIFEKKLRRFKFIKLAWELDSHDVLHCHILAEGPFLIKYRLIHLYGWHIDIRHLKTEYDKIRWDNYLNKGDSLEALVKAESRFLYLLQD